MSTHDWDKQLIDEQLAEHLRQSREPDPLGKRALFSVGSVRPGPLGTLALYERNEAAQDAGVSPKGSGFTGISFHYIVGDHDAVDQTIKQALSVGGTLVREAAASEWGGYFGYFADPDGYLWKVASPA